MNKQGNIMNKLNKKDKTWILEYLELIENELTDAYNTAPDTPENSDSLYYIDTAKDLVDELTTRLEDPQEEPVPHEDMDREGGLKGPDGLPLNFPFGDK